MSSKAIKYLKDSNIAIVFAAFALVAEIITAIIVSIMSILFHGRIGNDFLITGAIAAFVATLGTTQVTYYLLKELREGDRITEMLTFNSKILNTSSIGIFTYDASGQCIFANEAAAVILGATVDDLLLQNFHQIRSWKESGIYELALRALNTNNEQQAEVHVVTTAGKDVWLNLRFSSFQAKGEKHLLVFCHDISERNKAEREVSQSEERSRQQRNAIAILAVDNAIASGDIPAAARKLTETIAAAARVERASVWLLSETRRELRCVSLFEKSAQKHSNGLVLHAADYPRYFETILAQNVVNAHDARTDQRTREFTEGYLLPLGITSMLDAAIISGGELAGVVCLEHTGEKREWKSDEEAFAGTMASLLAQALGNAKRRQAEDELQKHRERLEELVNERTAELKTKIAEIENMNNVFVDRELRMIELKARIKELESEKK